MQNPVWRPRQNHLSKGQNNKSFSLSCGKTTQAIISIGLLLMTILLALPATVMAKSRAEKDAALQQLSKDLQIKQEARDLRVAQYALEHGKSTELQSDGLGRAYQLVDVVDGRPMYYITNNAIAAKTIAVDKLYPGGAAGLSLTGSGVTLHIWDAGSGLSTHQEFGGRLTVMDGAASHYHSTHVAGTMIAAGVVASAKGMSYEASLKSYEWTSDGTEMAAQAAAGAKVSNHSYGYITGWYYDGSDWYWYGDVNVSTTEAEDFGRYSSFASEWDAIAENAPDYLICKSADNDRNDTHTGTHYHWDNGWVSATDVHPPDGNSGTGYDSIPQQGCAKNVMTVGAVNDIPDGYVSPASVVMSSFSGWGPADDGRIKPDIVANGIGLYSCDNGNNIDYTTLSGTSMSTPNASGATGLLLEHYGNTHGGGSMLSATLKGLIIHCADEAGTTMGPDYAFGWGLMNTETCANTITADVADPAIIQELNVTEEADYEETFTYSGTGPIRATVCWTDPAHSEISGLDNTTKALVNDLDLVVIAPNSTTYYPWRLDGSNPANAATQGVNNTDNVEMVDISSPPVAGDYTVRITHTGTLSGGDQDVSLILSGMIFTPKPPKAFNDSVTTRQDTPITVNLQATDDGQPDPPGMLTYIITSLPGNGSLTDPGAGAIGSVPYTIVGNGNQVVYTPDSGYPGLDSFQFKANDGGVPTDGGDSNAATVSISIVNSLYFANMDIDPGWSVTGQWQYGDPKGRGGGAHGNRDPDNGYTGSEIVGYNLSGNYGNNIDPTEWATTPSIDCTAMINITLSFYRWLNVEMADYDHAYIEVSNDGSTWNTIWENSAEITDSSWTLQTYDISAFANAQPTVYIRWGMGTTDGSWRYSGWNIDDMEITGNVTTPQHTLTTSSTAGGSVTTPGEPGPYNYEEGTNADIVATPDAGYHFDNWTGSGVTAGKVADPNAADTTITMDADYAVQANFAIDTYTVTFVEGANGSITGTLLQIVDHGSDCTEVSPIADPNYHFDGWTGDYTGADDPLTIQNVTADMTIQANFAIDQMTISGYLLEPDDATAIEGILIKTDDPAIPDVNDITDPNGYYELTVDYGWSGIVEPNAVGYLFDPNETDRTLTNVTSSTVLDLTGYLEAFIISGNILNDDITPAPIEGVTVTPQNGGGYYTAKYDDGGWGLTDAGGYYEALVDYDWSGNMTPTHNAYVFDPNKSNYDNVAAEITDQDYAGTMLTYKITGYIENSNMVPIPGVLVEADNGGTSDTTDAGGYYEVWVDYGWTGTVTPGKTHYTFVDPNSEYTNVIVNKVDDYTATNIYDIDLDGSIGLGDLVVISNNWLFYDVGLSGGDLYNDEDDIVNLLDFAYFVEVYGD